MKYETFNTRHRDDMEEFIKRKDIKIKHISVEWNVTGQNYYHFFYKKRWLWKLFKRKGKEDERERNV